MKSGIKREVSTIYCVYALIFVLKISTITMVAAFEGYAFADTVKLQWPQGNICYKAQVIPIGSDASGKVVYAAFDTELLRLAAMWTSERPWSARHFNHGPATVYSGLLQATASKPGWSTDAAFLDSRTLQFGNLPAETGRWLGLYRYGSKTILKYRIAQLEIREHLETMQRKERTFVLRHIEIPAHERQLLLNLAELPDANAYAVKWGQWPTTTTTTTIAAAEMPCREGWVYLYGETPYLPVSQGMDRKTKQPLPPQPPPDRFELNPAIGAFAVPPNARWQAKAGQLVLALAPSENAYRLTLCYFNGQTEDRVLFESLLQEQASFEPLEKYCQGGPVQFPEVKTYAGKKGEENAAYVVDDLSPFGGSKGIGAVDFYPDGSAVVATLPEGDLYEISNIDLELNELKIRRIACGLYQPMGLKIVKDTIYVLGREQLTRLHDLNHDGEMDYYENFNNDHKLIAHFFDYAFDLACDAEGNFYYSKSGPVADRGRGFERIFDTHGCILKVDREGKTLSVVASGLRAANGIGVGPGGVITTSDNEGTFVPTTNLIWVKPGEWLGVVDTAHRRDLKTDPWQKREEMKLDASETPKPLCWIPHDRDNSGGGQVWVPDERWGPLNGRLLHCSYGSCRLFLVLKDRFEEVVQGGVFAFPFTFRSGSMRLRFNPQDGQLYTCGVKSYQCRGVQNGCLQRVRYTGKALAIPIALQTRSNGVELRFSSSLATPPDRLAEAFSVSIWDYVWSQEYGSPRVNERKLEVEKAALMESRDGVFLQFAELQPTMQMRINYQLEAEDGQVMKQELNLTLHRIPTE